VNLVLGFVCEDFQYNIGFPLPASVLNFLCIVYPLLVVCGLLVSRLSSFCFLRLVRISRVCLLFVSKRGLRRV
jgi:hypothetical protein